MSKTERVVLYLYALWATFIVSVCLMRDGLSADNFTRLLIIAYLFVSLGWYWRTRKESASQTYLAFVLKCSLSALVAEFCYMFSRPVFPQLRVMPGDSFEKVVQYSLIDFAFTFPAYLVFFSIFWILINRYQYRIAEYVILFSLSQALGDGNAFFLANPGALILAPYVILNYQAINIVPYLRVRNSLNPPYKSRIAKYILPLVLIPAAYWIMGALIIVIGRQFGFGS